MRKRLSGGAIPAVVVRRPTEEGYGFEGDSNYDAVEGGDEGGHYGGGHGGGDGGDGGDGGGDGGD